MHVAKDKLQKKNQALNISWWYFFFERKNYVHKKNQYQNGFMELCRKDAGNYGIPFVDKRLSKAKSTRD